MTGRRQRSFFSGFKGTNWLVACLAVFLFALLTFFLETPAVTGTQLRTKLAVGDSNLCPVNPRFLTAADVDAVEVDTTIPAHVLEFDKRNVRLPKYPASEIFMVSVTSNNTYKRQIAQKHTFGRIFDIRFVTYDDFPSCILCLESDQDNRCHCPSFRTPCEHDIFFDRGVGWWCATRKQVLAVQIALDEWEGDELPKWLHLLDDNSFVNPITEMLLIENLDPEKPYWIGDDFGDFLGGGPGKLLSRGLLKKLIGPPVVPVVTYNWPNGTHSIEVETQLQSCLARMQGGDWCFFHGDWGIGECVREVGVPVTDVGNSDHQVHGGFFTQFFECCGHGKSWFNLRRSSVTSVLHHTHTIAIHVSIQEMYDVFYDIIVPFYENLYKAS